MEALYIPESVVYIGKGVFEGINGIQILELPFLGETRNEPIQDNVATLSHLFVLTEHLQIKWLKINGGSVIGIWAFVFLEHLEEVYLSDSIEYVEGYAFYGCTKLRHVHLPNNLEVISTNTFYGCSQLESVEIPSALVSIEWEAFYRCSNLMELILPKTLSTISEGAFLYCNNLNIILDPENPYFVCESGVLYSADHQIIYFSPSGENVLIIPDEQTAIGSYAYAGMDSLIEVVLPDSITEIGVGAFQGCKNLKTIRFSKGLKKICLHAFSNCTSLERIELPEGLEIIDTGAFIGCVSLKEVNLPESLSVLGSGSFAYTALEEITIPDSITKLQNAFMLCSELRVIDFGKVEIIDDGCFENCESLESIVLPDTITAVKRGAFQGCSQLKDVVVSKSVEFIDPSAFSGCISLERFIVDPDSDYIYKDGILYSEGYRDLIKATKSTGSTVILPEGVLTIGAYAFSENTEITNIVLPSSLEVIGEGAFESCNNLINVTIGDNVRKIGVWAFGGTGLDQLSQKSRESVFYIGKYAIDANSISPETDDLVIRDGTILIADQFSMYGYRKLIIPDSVRYIGEEFVWSDYDASQSLKIRWSKNIEKIEWLNGEKYFNAIQLTDKYVPNSNQDLSNIKVDWFVYQADGFPKSSDTFWLDYENIITYYGPIKMFVSDMGPKNIVFDNIEQMKNSQLPYNSKVFIRVGKNEVDSYNIDNYGNTIYYEGEWNLATFYVDGMIVSMLPVRVSEIVKSPAKQAIKQFLPTGAEFVGWDIDGDGKEDELPATLNGDLNANAVYRISSSMLAIPSEQYYYQKDDKGAYVYDENGLKIVDYRRIDIENGDSKVLVSSIINREKYHDLDLVWSSSDESCLTIDQDGKITAIDVPEGDYVTVRVSLKDDPEVFSEVRVYIKKKREGIKLKEFSASVNVDQSYQLSPECVVPEGYAFVTYVSEYEDIATVDGNGVITAIAPGSTAIYIRCGTSYSAVFTIYVIQPLESLSLLSSEGTINLGETTNLTPVYLPADSNDEKTIFWYSKNASVAKVDQNGTITAVNPGETEIIGVLGDFTVTYCVAVKAPLERITLNTTKGTLRLDHTKQLDVIYIPSNTTDARDVVWSSADPTIASVDENGLVTGLKNGKTVITGTVGAGTSNEKSATYTVSVIGLRDEATGITITNSDDTEMPEGTGLVVEEVDEETAQQQYGDYRHGIRLLIKDKHGRIYILYIYDISLYRDEAMVQPDGYVDVEIPFPSGLLKNGGQVFRMEEDGTYTDMQTTYRNGHFYFKTNHFSVYCLAVATDEYEAAEVELDKTEVNLCVGKTDTVTATVLPEEASDRSVTFESADESVATVDAEGMITAVGVGNTMITAKSAVDGVEASIEVTVNEHTVVIDKAVAATCTKTGLTKGSHCSVCGEILNAQKTVKAKAHTEVVDAAVSATCTEPGLTAGKHCSVCNEVLVAQKTVNAKGHSWNDGVISKPATCKEEGVITYTCDVCEEQKTDKINKKAHTVVIDKAIAATSDKTGLTEGSHCSVCGEVIKAQEVIPKLGTKYSGEWVNGLWYNKDGTQTYKHRLSWKKDKKGWWVQDTSGWYPKNSWQKIDGKWYYFKASGYMASNEWCKGYWLNKNGTWTYKKKASWHKDKVSWWYGCSGWYARSQWQKIDNKWYYFDAKGYITTGTKKIGGKTYRFDENGVCLNP